ncbi:MAG: hypothetical protein KFB95_09965 [Simkaniaceae bacterium]|nr:MAG: hypothetical protein KFB95_09965 [Simkaniaceae bacterium]
MSNYAAFAVLSELSKVTANNTASTLAMMANMDVKTLHILSTAYKVNSSTQSWLWVYRIGTVGSLTGGLLLCGPANGPGPLVAGGISAIVFFILWMNLSEKISYNNYWHGKCIEFINQKQLLDASSQLNSIIK